MLSENLGLGTVFQMEVGAAKRALPPQDQALDLGWQRQKVGIRGVEVWHRSLGWDGASLSKYR